MDERRLTRIARRLIECCRARGLSVPRDAERLRSVPGSLCYMFGADSEDCRTTITVSRDGVTASVQRLAGSPSKTYAPAGLTFDALALWVEAQAR